MMSKQKGEKTENSHRVQGTIPNAVRRWLKTSNAKNSSNLTESPEMTKNWNLGQSDLEVECISPHSP